MLDRDIAERGRFPAVNIRKSVSRCLPKAASADENDLINLGRSLIAAYDEAAPMIQTGLYAAGSDPTIDHAMALWPKFEELMGAKTASCDESFDKLREIILSEQPVGDEVPVDEGVSINERAMSEKESN